MSTTLTMKMFLTPFRYSHMNAGDVHWALSSSEYKPGEYNAIGASVERAVVVDIPENFNPVAAEVESLNARKVQALQDYQNTVAQINDRLSKLLAIECGVAA